MDSWLSSLRHLGKQVSPKVEEASHGVAMADIPPRSWRDLSLASSHISHQPKSPNLSGGEHTRDRSQPPATEACCCGCAVKLREEIAELSAASPAINQLPYRQFKGRNKAGKALAQSEAAKKSSGWNLNPQSPSGSR